MGRISEIYQIADRSFFISVKNLKSYEAVKLLDIFNILVLEF